jgi:hypothetical protein
VDVTLDPQVSRSRSYAPDLDDVGHLLKYEAQAVDVATGQPIGPLSSFMLPQRVISAPQPPLRRMVGIVPDAERVGRFTVLSYNVLADLYASVSAPSISFRSLCELSTRLISFPGNAVRQFGS